jgi:eukaryotic-like serine/threonine-protein kinase
MQPHEPTSRFARFGSFEADLQEGKLAKSGYRIRLQEQPFRILALLLEHSGELVTREEIRQKLWAHNAFVEFDAALNTAVRKLREALNDSADNPRFLETVPRRGYRFVAPVALPSEPQSAASIRPHVRRHAYLWLAVAMIVAGAAVGGYWHLRRPVSQVTPEDTIVLADFVNNTGDAIFDDTLKTALSIALRQSPFLNVLSDSEVAKTLQRMTRPADTKLTPEVARELCQRAGSKAYLAGSVGSLGSQYVLGLKAINCQNGDTLAQEQVTTASKEEVLDALGEMASKLRTELGESLATVQKFDVPLAQATTSSLEALKAYSLGLKAGNEKGFAAGLPYHQRAIELDPNFAMGYRVVGRDYNALGQLGRAIGYYTRAFQLRDRASEREKLSITAAYYRNVTGELDKAARTSEEQMENYPRDGAAYNNRGLIYAEEGQYEKGVEMIARAVRLGPDVALFYENLTTYTAALQRFDDTQRIILEAQTRKIDASDFHSTLYAVAFLARDSSAMAVQQQWFAGKPDSEGDGLSFASDTEAFAGHLGKARELIRLAVKSAVRADNKESAALYLANAALRQAAYGNPAEARQSAAEALNLAPASPGVVAEAALAFAAVGDTSRSESLARNLSMRYPLGTQMQSLWLPAIRARLALARNDPSRALSVLQAPSAMELGVIPFSTNTSCLHSVYIRGEAYLASGQGDAATAEFHRILDHGGIVWNCWTGALAHLGVARANALQSRASQGADADAARARALAAYKDFLTLWKDANPNIPILKEARAEYEKLRLQGNISAAPRPGSSRAPPVRLHQPYSHTPHSGARPAGADLLQYY